LISIKGICSDYGFRTPHSDSRASFIDPYCDSENQFITNFHFTAANPHLRLDVKLEKIDKQDISGVGIQSTSVHPTYVDIKFDSLSADLMTPNQTGLIHFVGDTVANPPLRIFTAFIENGCLGSPPATLDLSLTSAIYGDLHKDYLIGGVQFYDEVIGHGYYNFNYTIRAEDDEGNISDFQFSGDASSTCVAEFSVN
jgi:hypothetical protein